MPDLTIQVQEVKGLTGTAVVILNGSIDAKTVITFQTHLNSVKERGINRFILDMEAVKYVNSTGLGYLINLSDSLNGDQGGISLVKVQPKVKVVFDMLGLNAFFKIYQTRDEALKHFTAAGTIAGPTDQTVVLKAGPQAQTAKSGPTSAVAVVERPGPAGQPRAAPPPVVETLNIECGSCKALLAVREVGTYKCPRCFTLFNYVGGGKASFLPRRKTVPVQLSLNLGAECTDGLLEFVNRIASKAGFSAGGAAEVQRAVKDTVETIKRFAYGGEENNIYHVLLLATDAELEIRFADYGASLSADRTDDRGRSIFATAKEMMDKVEIKNHPKGGNVLTFSKKAK